MNYLTDKILKFFCLNLLFSLILLVLSQLTLSEALYAAKKKKPKKAKKTENKTKKKDASEVIKLNQDMILIFDPATFKEIPKVMVYKKPPKVVSRAPVVIAAVPQTDEEKEDNTTTADQEEKEQSQENSTNTEQENPQSEQ